MDILIFGGQSNMQGQTEGLPQDNAPVNGALEYRYLTDEFVPLQHPVGEDVCPEKWIAASSGAGGSLVPDFCRAYTLATGREVLAVHTAKGSTTLAEWLHGTQHHYWAQKKWLGALKKAKTLGEVGHIYYVWLQGESDALIQTSEKEYFQKLIAYKNELKAEVGIEKFGIIKVGYFARMASWVAGSLEEKTAWDEAIMSAQERAVKEDGDFVMLTRVCTELSQNPEHINPKAVGHYNNASMTRIGTEAGNALAEIAKQ